MKTRFSYLGWINAVQLSIHEEMWKAIRRTLRVCFRLRRTRNPVSGKGAVLGHAHVNTIPKALDIVTMPSTSDAL